RPWTWTTTIWTSRSGPARVRDRVPHAGRRGPGRATEEVAMSEHARRALFALTVAAAVVLGAAPEPADAQNWRETTVSRQLEGAAPVRTEVTYGAGTLTLRGTD